MGRRREWRGPFAAAVSVAGTSPSGQPYKGTAHTLEISRNGVRMGVADFRARVGEVLTLYYRNRCARYRVIWIADTNGPQRGLIGLNLLAD